MNSEMRRKDRQLTEEEAIEILRNGEWGVLSTLCQDGYPYGTPISYVYEDGKIYFHGTSAAGLKSDNIERHPQACFTVVGKTELLPSQFGTKYESAIVFGTVKKSTDTIGVLQKLVAKYSADFTESGEKFSRSVAAAGRVAVYEMTVEQITGKGRRNG